MALVRLIKINQRQILQTYMKFKIFTLILKLFISSTFFMILHYNYLIKFVKLFFCSYFEDSFIFYSNSIQLLYFNYVHLRALLIALMNHLTELIFN